MTSISPIQNITYSSKSLQRKQANINFTSRQNKTEPNSNKKKKGNFLKTIPVLMLTGIGALISASIEKKQSTNTTIPDKPSTKKTDSSTPDNPILTESKGKDVTKHKKVGISATPTIASKEEVIVSNAATTAKEDKKEISINSSINEGIDTTKKSTTDSQPIITESEIEEFIDEQINYINSLKYEEAKNLIKLYPEYKHFIKSYLVTNDATPAIEIILVRDEAMTPFCKGDLIEETNPKLLEKNIKHLRKILVPKEEYVYMFESWYIHYMELCKKYGVSPRECGIAGGAVDHYYELQKREKSLEEYEKYIQLQENRAQYDKKAFILRINREKDNDVLSDEIANLLKSALETKHSDIYILNKVINLIKKQDSDCENKIKIILQTLTENNANNASAWKNFTDALYTIEETYNNKKSETKTENLKDNCEEEIIEEYEDGIMEDEEEEDEDEEEYEYA